MKNPHSWLFAGAMAAMAVLPAQGPDTARRRPVRTETVRTEAAQAILPAASPYQILVNVDGVRHHSSTNPAYVDWMEVESWGQAVTRPGGAGAPSFGDLAISGAVDPSLPQLTLLCAQASSIPQVQIHVLDLRVSTSAPVLKLTLTNAAIVAVDLTQGTQKGVPVLQHTIRFRYDRIEWETTSPQGPIRSGWNLVTNSPV